MIQNCKGAFFGENANEMGGVYINEKEGFSGAFSARHEWQLKCR